MSSKLTKDRIVAENCFSELESVFEKDHHYECNGKKVGISVTRLIEEYSNPFDQQAIAEKVALRDNKSVSEMNNFLILFSYELFSALKCT